MAVQLFFNEYRYYKGCFVGGFTMLINKVSAGRGAAWINESIGLLKTGGMAIWLPALLVGFLGSLPYLGGLLGVLIIFFYGSLVLIFDQPNAHHNALSGFTEGRFSRLFPILALNIVLGAIAIFALWPTLQPIYEAGLQGTKLSEEQALVLMMNFAKQLLWLIPVSIFLSWITQFAVPLVSISGLSGGEAILQALSAIKRNWSALLVNFICIVVVVIIISIIIMLPMMLISAALASSPLLMNIAIMPFTTVLTAAMVALMSGNMLYGETEANTTKDNELLI
jgi:hypothetical protein